MEEYEGQAGGSRKENLKEPATVSNAEPEGSGGTKYFGSLCHYCVGEKKIIICSASVRCSVKFMQQQKTEKKNGEVTHLRRVSTCRVSARLVSCSASTPRPRLGCFIYKLSCLLDKRGKIITFLFI